jgi:hypothetical protein
VTEQTPAGECPQTCLNRLASECVIHRPGTEDGAGTDERLLWMLRVLGDEFGPLGVIRTTAKLWPDADAFHRTHVTLPGGKSTDG